MTVFPLLAAGLIMKVVAVLFVICAVVLVLAILIQKGKGGGLSGVLAGGAVSGILGSKAKEPLTWITIVLVGMFLTLAVVLAKSYRPTVSDFGAGGAVQQQPSPEQPSIPVAPEQKRTGANSLGVR